MQKQEQKSKQTNPFSEMEKDVLNFWEKNKIFEKSVTSPPAPLLIRRGEDQAERGRGEVKDYVFYDGPPFATGTPHYGHIVASIMKDVVPRYWTMQGYKVERKWGWDCHGLPIENIVEKEMGLKSKKDIEKIGVEKFNELCRSKVLGYVEDWKKVIKRLGRWADMENAYKTMDLDFMESVWWVFKELYDKGLIYEGYRSMLVCPRCETTLSQQEVAEGYKDIKDLSVIVKFELVDESGTFVLAWTTTPWTLIGNVALAVGEDIDYVLLRVSNSTSDNFKINEIYIMSNDAFRKHNLFSLSQGHGILRSDEGNLDKIYINFEKASVGLEKIKIIKGKDLIGKKYKPLFKFLKINLDNERAPFLRILKTLEGTQAIKDILDESYYRVRQELKEKIYKIYHANFVNTEEGTGIVHIAPAFGEDDINLANKEKFPAMIQHVNSDGTISADITYHDEDEIVNSLVGKNVKPIGDHMSTDIEIIKYLAHHNLLFSKEKYEHSYPHCWRCETPLINYATTSWFVNILKIKDKMLKTAKKINWSPAHIKEGRFGKWLEGARDWSISRQRFWASVIPIWICAGTRTNADFNADQRGQDGCGNMKVVGSVKELEELSGQKVDDLHKHKVDKITFPCECGGTMKRVPDVLDTWFDSGSMPYAQMHYPFENKEKFEKNFPAEFIAEGIDQTRAWFYYLHAIANGIKKTHAFKNVAVNGIVLAEDGKKMSKRLNNYPDPMFVFDQYGADALRYCLLTSPVMLAENLNFAEKGVQESLRNVVMTLWNVFKFYEMYADSSLSLRGENEAERSERRSNLVAHRSNHGITSPAARNDNGNVLDQWILARLNQLIKEVTEGMNNYNLPKAARPIKDFVNDFSTWYLRRSRERFKNAPFVKGGKGGFYDDKQAALATTKFVLLELSKIMAPFMPFVAENLWQKVTGNDFKDENKSVHLEAWPITKENKETRKQGNSILQEMEVIRKIVELGLAERDKAGIKVRQPIASLKIKNHPAIGGTKIKNEFFDLIKDEVNVKNIEIIKGDGELSVKLDTKITAELKLEGIKRELVRFINNLRKEAVMTIRDRAAIYWQSDSEGIRKVFEKFGEEVKRDTLCDKIAEGVSEVGAKKEVKINGEIVILGVKKI